MIYFILSKYDIPNKAICQPMTPQPLTIQLIEKKLIAANLLELKFTKPDGFTFQAGQFVQFLVPNNGTATRRSYSVSSAPSDPYLEFCIKIFPDGIGSGFCDQLEAGGTIDILGPRGRFILANESRPSFFIATGTGIAPIMSMIRDEIETKKTTRELKLLFGVRSENDLFWHDRLDVLKNKSDFFSYILTLSQPKPDGSWSGLKGRVTDHIIHHIVDHDFYLCGSAAMVKDVRELLIQNGTAPAQIHFEIF